MLSTPLRAQASERSLQCSLDLGQLALGLVANNLVLAFESYSLPHDKSRGVPKRAEQSIKLDELK
jgi:hypothetical protein